MLGRRIATRQPPPTILPELRRALLDEWCQDQIDNLILSMPRRWILPLRGYNWSKAENADMAAHIMTEPFHA
ncbi:hypothetical protein TNCV_3965371 [Trichonephila clavipes]|nr:hypothetical protein TNCV_3965371 [Trichonephila clavipes]